MLAAYEGSDKYKEEQLKLQREQWQRTQEILKQLKEVLDKDNNVRLKSLSQEGFLKLLRSGALEQTALTTNNDNPKALAQQRPMLENNISYFTKNVEDTLSRYGDKYPDIANQIRSLNSELRGISSISDNKLFIDKFNTLYKELVKVSNRINPNLQSAEDIKDLIGSMTFKFTGDASNADLDIESILSKNSNLFIPLWKRILGNATGISPNVMSSTRETLDWYKNDMAIRSRTSGVLASMLRGGGSVSDVQSLLKTSTVSKKLRGDGGYTYQIDWKATNKAVEEFALKLSSTTDVISAYKTGLENERDAYIKLLSEGLTAAETEDLKNGKFVSAKKYEELSKDYGEQLVNAFGEKLLSKDGLTVSVKDGKFVDTNGNEIAQEDVVLTGNIYEILQTNLKEINQKIATASLQENQNVLLNKLTTSTLDNQIISELLNKGASYDVLKFARENPDYINSSMNPLFTQYIKEAFEGKFDSFTDVLDKRNSKNEQERDNAEIAFSSTVDSLIANLTELLNNSTFVKSLEDYVKNERNTRKNDILTDLKQYDEGRSYFDFSENGITNARDWKGWRGIKITCLVLKSWKWHIQVAVILILMN